MMVFVRMFTYKRYKSLDCTVCKEIVDIPIEKTENIFRFFYNF